MLAKEVASCRYLYKRLCKCCFLCIPCCVYSISFGYLNPHYPNLIFCHEFVSGVDFGNGPSEHPANPAAKALIYCIQRVIEEDRSLFENFVCWCIENDTI